MFSYVKDLHIATYIHMICMCACKCFLYMLQHACICMYDLCNYIYIYNMCVCMCMCMYILCICVCAQENAPPLTLHVHHNTKRCLPLTTEEKREICKRITTHHMDNNGVFNLEADNGLPVTFVHVPRPRKGTADVCKRTVQQRSHIIETVQQLVSTPFTSTSSSTSNHHLHAQLT